MIITRKSIHKGIDLTPRTVIDDLIYKGGGIVVLGASPIDILVVNTDPNSALLLIHRDSIGNPLCQRDRIYEARFKKFLNFCYYSSDFPTLLHLAEIPTPISDAFYQMSEIFPNFFHPARNRRYTRSEERRVGRVSSPV